MIGSAIDIRSHYLSEVKKVVAPETTSTAKEMRSVWETLCLAKKVGKSLGAGGATVASVAVETSLVRRKVLDLYPNPKIPEFIPDCLIA